MHGSATCTAPASAGASTTTRPARSERHLWVPRDLGNAGLLLALVLDGDRWPNNATCTANMLGVTPEAVRRWRGWLSAAGLMLVDGSFLVATEAGRECLAHSDPLPRALLRGARPTPKELRACAAIYGECIGWRADRRGVRSDADRAAALCIGRATVAEARRLLVARGLVKLEKVQRGRARLVRPRAELDAKGKPVGAHGSPLCELARQRLAIAAERGRSGANGSSSEGANRLSHPHQVPSEPFLIRAENGPDRQDGAAPPGARDEQTSSAHDAANAVARLARVAQGGGDVLAELARQRAEQNPQQQAEHAQDREASTRQRAERLLADGPRLKRATDNGRTADLLAAFGVFDHCDRVPKHRAESLLDRRRQGLALRLAKVAGSTSQAALIVAQIGAAAVRWGKLRSLGALVASRLVRFVADANLADVAGDWATLDANAIAAVFRGERPAPRIRGERRGDAPPMAKDHAGHPHVRRLRSLIIGAAQAGDWRALRCALGEPIARELGLDSRAVSEWSGVPERSILVGLTVARETASARFDADRRALG